MFVYLDNSATTRVKPEVAETMASVLTENFGNPSSLHRLGLNAEKILKASRKTVADSIGAAPEEIWFTSCGTESDNTVLRGVWESRKKQGKRIITTKVEHPAILRCCEDLEREGADVVYLPVTADGFVDMDALRSALTPDTILVSVMHVNNESGAIMPIADIRREISKVNKDIYFHTDAVQSYEKVDVNVKTLGVDFLSISGHKIHASKGIGVLYVRNGIHLPAFVLGGGQESGHRSGTENLPGIAGLAKAVELAETNKAEKLAYMAETKAYLLKLISEKIPDIKVNTPDFSAPSVLNISFLNCRGEVLLHMLEEKEIYVSTGSACSSNSKKHGSHVLTAMGLKPEETEGAIRFSFSTDNTKEQMEYVADSLAECVRKHRKLMGR